MDDRFDARAEKIADQERGIQERIDAKDARSGDSVEQGAVQAGARRYPEPPFPKQHQTKPGDEAALDRPCTMRPSGRARASLRDSPP